MRREGRTCRGRDRGRDVGSPVACPVGSPGDEAAGRQEMRRQGRMAARDGAAGDEAGGPNVQRQRQRQRCWFTSGLSCWFTRRACKKIIFLTLLLIIFSPNDSCVRIFCSVGDTGPRGYLVVVLEIRRCKHARHFSASSDTQRNSGMVPSTSTMKPTQVSCGQEMIHNFSSKRSFGLVLGPLEPAH
jgi:hypothetical protein